MQLSIHLADSAQVADGKVHALGLGWAAVSLPTPSTCLVIFLDVDWSVVTTEVALSVELVDADGDPVCLPAPRSRPGGARASSRRSSGVPDGTPAGMATAARALRCGAAVRAT